MKTVSFVSLGCRVNQYEIQALREEFINNGYSVVPDSGISDFCIINTCAVTGESEKKSRHAISKASKLAKKVVITGCYAELCRQNEKLPDNVFYCGGCSKRDKILEICNGADIPYCSKDSYESLKIGTTDELPNERYRAYVKIEDGCNGKCAYCIIPKLRGRSYNRKESDIVDEIKRLGSIGVSEIILTGIEVSDYGSNALCKLIEKVNATEGIKRIRLGSLNPNTITPKFIETALKCEKLCRHFHLSVQSGCGKILYMMHRPYTAEMLNGAIYRIYSSLPDAMLTADIISGFPGETEEDFTETLKFAENAGFMHIHAFPYSPRPFTEAANMPFQVDEETKKRRNAAIINVSESNKKKIAESLYGKTVNILVEKKSKCTAYGHTDKFMEAKVEDCKKKPGEYIDCIVIGFDGSLICREI